MLSHKYSVAEHKDFFEDTPAAIWTLTDTRRLLYLTFDRSPLNCAGEIWAPQSIGNISKVESLQWRATKFMLNLSWTESTSYQDRLIKLNLLPILLFMKSMIFFSILLQMPILGHYSICHNDLVQQLSFRFVNF